MTDLRRLDGVGLGESESGFGGRGRSGGGVPHPGAVTERVADEGREAAARRRRECRVRRAGHAEAAQQARRAAEEEPGGEHGGGSGGCGGGHGGSAEARYISAAVASPAVRSGRPPLYASATADTVRLPSTVHVGAF